MNPQHIKVIPVFSTDDQAWIRLSRIAVPPFWNGHDVPPARGDVLRVGA
jgi:hypothetical protein